MELLSAETNKIYFYLLRQFNIALESIYSLRNIKALKMVCYIIYIIYFAKYKYTNFI